MTNASNKTLLEELHLRLRAPPDPAFQTKSADCARSPFFNLAAFALLDSEGHPCSVDLGGLKWAVGRFVPNSCASISYELPKDAVVEAAPFMRLHLQGDAHFDNAALSEFLSKNSGSSSSVVPSFSLDTFLRSVDLAQKPTQENKSKKITIESMFAKAREKQKLAANGASSLPNNDKATNGVESAGEAASKSGGEKNEHMADVEEEKQEEEESASEEEEEEKSEASINAQAKRQKLDEPNKKQKKATKEKKDKKDKKDNENKKDKKDKKERKPMSISAYRVFSKEEDAKRSSNLSPAERAKELSANWKALPQEVKDKYTEMANKLNAEKGLTPVKEKKISKKGKAFRLYAADIKQHTSAPITDAAIVDQWMALPYAEKAKWQEQAKLDKKRAKEEQRAQGGEVQAAKKAKVDKKVANAADKQAQRELKQKKAEQEKEKKKQEKEALKEEKKAHGLEDMDLPNARTPPPPSKMINCTYPEHFGQLLVIYTMLNAFGELLHLRPVQYGDLELALKECSPLWEEMHTALLKFLTQETDTSTRVSAAPAADAAAGDEGDEGTARASPFSLTTVLRFTWATHSNWPEIARKYLIAQGEVELAAPFNEREYADVGESERIAMLEFLFNEFMTKSVSFRKFLDESAATLEELRKEKWQEIMAERQAKKKEKEEAAQPQPAAAASSPIEEQLLDRKAAAKKRKAEQEEKREQRKAADELRRAEKRKEQRRVQMNVIRGQLRASVCIGLDRYRRRYWLFGIGALDRRLLIEDPISKAWSTYETAADFEKLLKWLNKNGVRERKLLKKLQKIKDDVLEKIDSGTLDCLLERSRNAPTTRNAVVKTPLEEMRKQLLRMKAAIPSHGLTGTEEEWEKWEEEVQDAAAVRQLIAPLLALEAHTVPNSGVFIAFWTATLAQAWREELEAIQEGKEPFTTPKAFVYLEALQYAIKREGKDEIADKKCRVCKSSENDEKMLLCDRCDAGYHIFCLKPPLKVIPQNDWFCAKCSTRVTRRSPR